MFSDGVAILKIFLFEEAIYQRNGARCRRVLLIDGPAFNDLCSNRIEISGAHAQPRCPMVRRPGGGRRVSLNVYALAPIIAFHWAIKRKADLLDTRDSADIFFEP